jgi:hypothetical protein
MQEPGLKRTLKTAGLVLSTIVVTPAVGALVGAAVDGFPPLWSGIPPYAPNPDQSIASRIAATVAFLAILAVHVRGLRGLVAPDPPDAA